jgi:ATP-dependent helicase HrpA
LTAFPALVDQGDAVGVRAFPDPAAAAAAHAAGVLRLLRLELAEGLRYHLRHLGLSPKARLYYAVRGSVDALGESLLTALLERALPGADRIRSAAAFQALRDRVAAQLGPQLAELCAQLEPILLAYGTLRQRLSPPLIGYAAANLDDLRAQLDGLIGPELVARWGIDRLADLQRYLHAAEVRLERLTRDPVRDQTRMLDVLPFVRRLAELEREHPTAGAPLRRLRYAVEEFRVSLFAQELGTAEKISAKRLERLFQASVSELTRSG